MVCLGDNGTLRLTNGQYTLTETKAPEGYNLLAKAVSIKVSDTGVTYTMHEGEPESHTVKIPSGAEESAIIKIPNEPIVAPTGLPGNKFLYSFSAILLLLVGAVLLFMRMPGKKTGK